MSFRARSRRKSDGKRGDAIKACVPAQVIRFAVRLSRVNCEQVSDCASSAHAFIPHAVETQVERLQVREARRGGQRGDTRVAADVAEQVEGN